MISRRHALSVGLLLGLVILVVIALTGGLESVDFVPGRTFSATGAKQGLSPDWSGAPGGTFVLPGFDPLKILLPVCLAVFVLSVAFSIRDRRISPQVLLSLLLLAVVVLATSFASTLQKEDLEQVAESREEEEILDVAPRAAPGDAARIERVPGVVDSRWPVLVSSALAVILIGLVAVPVVLPWIRRRRGRGSPASADEILSIAADAASALEAGEDPIGVVQRCYARMLRALSDRAGVDPTYRTPREFAATLREAGIGSESVDALTEMFELVRYGGRSDGLFAQRAHGCLTALRLSHDAS